MELKDCVWNGIRYVVVTARRKSPFVIYSSVAYSKNMYPIRFVFCFLSLSKKVIYKLIWFWLLSASVVWHWWLGGMWSEKSTSSLTRPSLWWPQNCNVAVAGLPQRDLDRDLVRAERCSMTHGWCAQVWPCDSAAHEPALAACAWTHPV